MTTVIRIMIRFMTTVFRIIIRSMTIVMTKLMTIVMIRSMTIVMTKLMTIVMTKLMTIMVIRSLSIVHIFAETFSINHQLTSRSSTPRDRLVDIVSHYYDEVLRFFVLRLLFVHP